VRHTQSIYIYITEMTFTPQRVNKRGISFYRSITIHLHKISGPYVDPVCTSARGTLNVTSYLTETTGRVSIKINWLLLSRIIGIYGENDTKYCVKNANFLSATASGTKR
jgi:hypothetical protein